MKAFIDWYNKQEPAKQDYLETIIDYLMRDQLVELIQEVYKYKADFKIQPWANCEARCFMETVKTIKSNIKPRRKQND